jgi:hypothetical protein
MPLTFGKTAVRWESSVNLCLVSVPLIRPRVKNLCIFFEKRKFGNMK